MVFPDLFSKACHNVLCWASISVNILLRPASVHYTGLQCVQSQTAFEEAASSGS